MKVISSDGTRVIERNDPAIREIMLAQLKTARSVEIVSTDSANSLIVRVTFQEDQTAFRHDLVNESGILMHGDERWLPTTGKPVREVILKCVLVSPTQMKYTYNPKRIGDKNTATMENIHTEYQKQHLVFDKTKRQVPICPDVIALLDFPTRDSFEEVFFNKITPNPIYKSCRVFTQLRTYFSLPFQPSVAIIAMESIPASYKPLHDIKMNLHTHEPLIAQICAMYVVLFYNCGVIALDAHLNNWLYDMEQPEQLRIRLIDFGLCLDTANEPKRTKMIQSYFAQHADQLPSYLKLMGASADASPADVMQQAILSVAVPDMAMSLWLHKILVISMLMDGFANVLYSTTKQTCQMSHVFNVVYNDACVTLRHTLNTMNLDLNEYLKNNAIDSDSKTHTMEMFDQISSYLLRYGYVKENIISSRLGLDDAIPNNMSEEEEEVVALSRYGGNTQRRKTKTKTKTNKKKSIRRRRN